MTSLSAPGQGARGQSLRARALCTTVLISLAAGPGLAQTLNWDAGAGAPGAPLGGDGTWDTTTPNWQTSGGTSTTFTSGTDVVFGDADPVAPYAVTIDGGGITAGRIRVNSADMTFDGGRISPVNSNAQIRVEGGATATFEGLVDYGITLFAPFGTGTVVFKDLNTTGTANINGTQGPVTVRLEGGSIGGFGPQVINGATLEIAGGTITGTSGVNNLINSIVLLTDGAINNTLFNSGTATLSGGTVGSVVNNPSATLTMSDGAITGALTQSGTATLSGGTVGSLVNNGAATTTVDGAEVLGTTAINGGAVTVESGGTLTGDTTVADGRILNVNAGGTVGDVDLSNAGLLTVTGPSATTTVGNITQGIDSTVTLNSGTVGNLTANSRTNIDPDGDIVIDGDFDNGSEAFVFGDDIEVTGQTTIRGSALILNGGALSGPTQVIGGTLDINDGTTGNIALSPLTRLDVDGGEVTGNILVTGAVASISGGEVSGLLLVLDSPGDDGAATVDGGEVTGASFVYNGGEMTVETDGTVDAVDLSTSGTLTVNAGGTTGDITQDATGTLILNSGTVGSLTANTNTVIEELGTSTIAGNFNNGGNDFSFGSDIEVTGTTTLTGGTLTLTGGRLSGRTNVNPGATLAMSDGSAARVDNNGTTSVTGGSIDNLNNQSGTGTVDISGGTILSVRNTDGTVEISGGIVSGSFNDFGTFRVSGGTVGGITNTSGAVEVSNGTIGSMRNTNGTIDMTDGTVNDVITNVSGTTDVTGGTVRNIDNEGGTSTVDGTAAVTGTATVTGGNLAVQGGSVATLINHGGVSDITGGTVADLDNRSSTTTVDGGTVTGAATVSGGTLFMLSGDMTGVTTVAGGAMTMSGGSVATLNVDAGTFDQSGGAVGALGNAATSSLTGGTVASLSNTGGTTTLDGADVTGATRIGGGTLVALSGSLGGAVTVEGEGGTLDLRGVSTADALNVLSGTARISGAPTVNTGGGAGTGLTLGGRGVISFRDGATTPGALTVNGNAVLDGLVRADVNFDTLSADVIDVQGNLSGDGGFDLAWTGAETALGDGIALVTYTGSSSFSGDLAALSPPIDPDVNPFSYFVQDDGEGAVFLRNIAEDELTGGAAAAGLILSQSLVASIASRPDRPYVVPLRGERDPCGLGTWARITGGTADATGRYTDVENEVDVTTPVDLDYRGIQVGGDFGCYPLANSGWNLTGGGYFGRTSGDTTSTVSDFLTGDVLSRTSTDFEQTYAGVYVVASAGNFFGDLQFRLEDTDFNPTFTEADPPADDPREIGNYGVSGKTLAGEIGYRWDVPSQEGLTISPVLGFSNTWAEMDNVVITGGGASDPTVLEIGDIDTRLLYLGATLEKTVFNPADASQVSYFATGTYYSDQSGGLTVDEVTDGGGAVLFGEKRVGPLGSYGEVSAGINYDRILNPGAAPGRQQQISASFRADLRTGNNIGGWGLTGEMRWQF